MGTVHRLATAGDPVTLGYAVTAYLATLAGAEQAGTRTVYGRVLRRLEREHGAAMVLDELGAEAFAEWFTGQWNDRAPATWNGALDGFRSAAAYWADQGWTTEDPSRLLRRRRPRQDRSRALSRAEVETLLTRENVACASACCGACCMRLPRGRPKCSAWTSPTWTCPTGGPACGVRAAQ